MTKLWYLFCVRKREISNIFAYCLWDSYSAILTVHCTNTHSNSLPPHSVRSVGLPLLATEHLNLFIDVLCAAVHNVLLTAAVLCCNAEG